MATVDQYLIHSFAALVIDGELESMAFESDEPVLPMLVRFSDAAEVASAAERNGLLITSRIGNIVACLGTISTLQALQRDSRVVSVEASRPTSGNDCAISVPFVRGDVVQNDPQNPEKGEDALVAVIDGGIDVLHETFRDEKGQTRIVAVWDQTDPTGPGPTIPGSVSYGTLHSAEQINGYIASKNEKTFGEVSEHYLREYDIITQGQCNKRYVDCQHWRCRGRLVRFFGNLSISEITAGKIQDYRIHRHQEAIAKRGKPPGHSTMHQEIVTLRQVLKTALRHGWLDWLPDFSEPYRSSSKISHRAWFSPEEYKKLYEATRKWGIRSKANAIPL